MFLKFDIPAVSRRIITETHNIFSLFRDCYSCRQCFAIRNPSIRLNRRAAALCFSPINANDVRNVGGCGGGEIKPASAIDSLYPLRVQQPPSVFFGTSYARFICYTHTHTQRETDALHTRVYTMKRRETRESFTTRRVQEGRDEEPKILAGGWWSAKTKDK